MDDRVSKKSGKSGKSMFRDEEIENFVVVPPDGGWGWVVVTAAFFCNLIADGIVYTFGIFLDELSEAFNVTVGSVTMVGSITTFSYYFVGPFVSALVNRYGFRCVSVIGSVVAASGFALGSFCSVFALFTVFAGVLTGVGLGMITIPAVIVVGYYFEKWRALATGIATCGSGIGTLLTPPLVTFLLGRLDWRNTYRVLATIVLMTALLAIVYRPLMPIRAILEEKEIKVIQQTDSIGSFNVEQKKCCKYCCQSMYHNRYYPTTADIVPIETVVLQIPVEKQDDVSSYSYTTYTTATITNYTASVTQNNTQIVNDDSRVGYITDKKCLECWNNMIKRLCCGRCETASRPMYRDDIFFGHSLMLLPQYKESLATQQTRPIKIRSTHTSRALTAPKNTGYHMSVTRVTTHREVFGDKKQKCVCSLAILRTLSTMLNLKLLRSPAFQVFSCSGMFVVFGYMIPYLYIKDRAMQAGVSGSIAFWLLSAIGAANTIGRIVCGILPSVTNLNVIVYSYICIFIAGITTILSGFLMNIEFQFFYACIYGLAGSCIATLRPIIVVELFGLEHLTNAFGLQLMFMAFAGFSGQLLAGIFYDSTKNFNVPFFMAGSCLIFSSFLLLFVKKIRSLEKKHNCSGGL